MAIKALGTTSKPADHATARPRNPQCTTPNERQLVRIVTLSLFSNIQDMAYEKDGADPGGSNAHCPNAGHAESGRGGRDPKLDAFLRELVDDVQNCLRSTRFICGSYGRVIIMDNNSIVLSEDPYTFLRTDTSNLFVLHHNEDGADLPLSRHLPACLVAEPLDQ